MKIQQVAGLHVEGLRVAVAADGVYLICTKCKPTLKFIHDRDAALEHMEEEHG